MGENVKLSQPLTLRRSRMPAWSEIVDPAGWVVIAVLAVLVLAAYWPELRRLSGVWLHDSDWTHGWLIPVIGLYIVHLNRDRLARVPVRPSLLGVPVMLFAVAMYLSGIQMLFGYPRSLSMLPMLLGMVMLMGGWRLALACWFPIFLLLFAIPLPHLIYFELTFPLRRMVTLLSTGALNLLPDVQATAQATVIDYIYGSTAGTLNVEEACSGMRLMMAFLAMGAIMAYLMREKPVWHRLTLLGLCVPIAIFCNFIRVTITSVLHVYGHRSLAEGGAHTVLGLGMMVVALGLFYVANWGLSSLVTEADPEEDEPEGVQA